ncbi:hypothetical protein Tco_0133616 [Tanacetum coccineum]
MILGRLPSMSHNDFTTESTKIVVYEYSVTDDDLADKNFSSLKHPLSSTREADWCHNNEPYSAPTRGNKGSSASKTNSAPADYFSRRGKEKLFKLRKLSLSKQGIFITLNSIVQHIYYSQYGFLVKDMLM